MAVIAEILESFPPAHPENINKTRFEYTISYQAVGGGRTTAFHALRMEPFTGVDNFQEVVLRASKDDGGKGLDFDGTEEKFRLSSGDCVVVDFINGDSRRPVILGSVPNYAFTPEDNQTSQLDSAPILFEAAKPQLRGRFNGFNYRIDEFGQTRLQHTGAPELQITSGLFVDAFDQDTAFITTLDFLSKGDFRIVDSSQQALVISPDQKFISLNNTTTPPGFKFEAIAPVVIGEPGSTAAPKGQEIRLDKANNQLTFLSAGTLQMVVGTDARTLIYGNTEFETRGNEAHATGGEYRQRASKSIDIKANKNYTLEANGHKISIDANNITIAHKGGYVISIDAAGVVKLDAQMVQIGAGAAQHAVLGESLITWLNTHTHPTSTGPSGPAVVPALPADFLSTSVTVKS